MTDPSSQTQPADNNSGIRARVKSVLLFLPFVLAVLWVGGWAFAFAIAALAGVAGFEWARMFTKGQSRPKPLTALVAGLCAFVVIAAMMVSSFTGILILTLSLSFLLFAACYAQARPNAALLCFSLIYTGIALSCMVWIRQGASAQGLYDMATLLFMVWASDTFAYFTGRAIGGPKLAPKISPKKTWAGFIGSSAGAALVGYIFAMPAVLQMLQVSTIGDMTPMSYAILGAVSGAVGQAGDLFISYFKRKFNVKDTGALIPGHGGVLDRIDALMLVAIVFWAVQQAVG
jgi:phosphatidate cytidylyltransferase